MDELPEAHPEWEDVEPVAVHTAAATIDADLIVATLRGSDVRAFAAGTGAEIFTEAGGIGQATRIPGPLNSIRIMVHPDDEERAREVLALAEEDVPDPEATLPPPVKWSLDETRRRRVVRIGAIFLLAPIVYGLVISIVEGLRTL